MKIDPDAYRYAARAWVLGEGIKNEFGQPVEFRNHRFLIDIFDDDRQEKAVLKASQVGLSTTMNIKLLHRAKFWGINQIYTLPTDKDVSDFVRSKTNRLIGVNPSIMQGLPKRSVESIEQKQIGKSFIFFRGTFGKSKAIMISADILYHDELDTSDPIVVEAYESRVSASSIRGIEYFSTPSVPNFGIDLKFHQSDQKFWRIKCPHCGEWYHQEWEDRDGYPATVDMERQCYFCPKCLNEVTPRQISDNGEWQAKYPCRPISGYWIPQTICPWISAGDLIRKREKAEDLQQFYNYSLGLPYISSDQQIEAGLFLKNIIEDKTENSKEQVYLGADIGGEKGIDVIIGKGKVVFWGGVLKDHFIAPHGPLTCKYCFRDKAAGRCGCRFDQLAELIVYYNVSVAVVDGMPSTEEVLALAREFPYRVYLSWFIQDPKLIEIVRWGEDQAGAKDFEDDIKVFTGRTRIIDNVISELRRGNVKFALPKDAVILARLIQHAATMYARNIEDRLGQVTREWANTGANDTFLAFVYYLIASKKNEV